MCKVAGSAAVPQGREQQSLEWDSREGFGKAEAKQFFTLEKKILVQ